MKTLSEAFKPIQTTLQNPEAQPLMPPLGSTTAGGQLTTTQPSPVEAESPQRRLHSNPNIHLGEGPPPWALPASPDGRPKATASSPSTSSRPHSEAEKAALAAALGRVCALQKQYGKTAEELETLVEGFSWALSDYPMPDILNALKQYITSHPDIPAPADLRNIIDPPPQELSAALYVSLQKKAFSGEYLLSDEREFCQRFRDQELAKMRGGSETLREANRQIEHFKLGLPDYASE